MCCTWVTFTSPIPTPYIDLDSKGDVEGFFKAIDKAIYLVNDDTRIIPGHGKLSSKSDLIEYRDTIRLIVNRIKATVEAGNSLEEVLNAGLTKEFDEEWATGFMNPERFTTIIYNYYSKDAK